MILTDREIQIAIEQKLVVIEPPPRENAFSSTSVDLTLDPALSEFRDAASGIERVVDPGAAGYDHEQTLGELTESVTIGAEGYVFHPGKLILAWTQEYVSLLLQAKIAARVEGKSSLARLGVGVHVTAPTIHAGFKGRIRLEMINHGKVPIRLRSGMKICQLIFEQTLGTPQAGYSGQFSGQEASKKG
ncbi:MAG: dCTP deaminase [Caulobacterales bacterium 32-69-10]|nr:MAG: dCTP deaminase [Caulobacterales bacterium 32-69-10]